MVFRWSLRDSKSAQVSRTLLNILADLNTAVVWMVSTRPLISKFSSPFTNPSLTVARAPIPIGIIVTFIFHSFFQFLSKDACICSSFHFFFNFTPWPAGTAKSIILQVLFFILIYWKRYQRTHRKNGVCYWQVIDHMEIGSLWLNKNEFLLRCSRVNTTVWMHHIDAYETNAEKTRRVLHENLPFWKKPWRQHSAKQFYGHLLLISQTIQIRWTRQLSIAITANS